MAAPQSASSVEGVSRESVELRLSSVVGAAAVAGATVRALASLAGIAPRRLTGIRAIVEELVIEARSRPTAVEEDEITVRATISDGMLEIVVADHALPVSPKSHRDKRARRLAALGYVDKLSVGAHGKEGNIALCTIKLDPEKLGAASGLVEEILPEDAPSVGDAEAESIEIRAMEAADAPELVRCVYRCYGYSYLDPLMYDPKAIRRALHKGEMVSIVAAAPDGTVAGHSAVFSDDRDDAVPEGGRLVVDPRYRGHGIAGRMAERRLELARERGYLGIWSEAVTNHVASQREVIDKGGSEVGLLVGAATATTAMAGFAPQGEGRRRSLLACFTPLRSDREELHVPERHAALIAELAERLGIERPQGHGEPAAADSESSMTSAVHTFSSLAAIRVARIGADLLAHVASTIESFDAFDLAAVHLDLPLSDPAAPAAAEQLERIGFCFAAWMPSFAAGSDVLRLQRVGSHPVDTETIACARPEGEAVRDYVLADWHRIRRGGDPA